MQCLHTWSHNKVNAGIWGIQPLWMHHWLLLSVSAALFIVCFALCMYACSCKKFSKAEKHFRVHRMPKVLTLHLKRLVSELDNDWLCTVQLVDMYVGCVQCMFHEQAGNHYVYERISRYHGKHGISLWINVMYHSCLNQRSKCVQELFRMFRNCLISHGISHVCLTLECGRTNTCRYACVHGCRTHPCLYTQICHLVCCVGRCQTEAWSYPGRVTVANVVWKTPAWTTYLWALWRISTAPQTSFMITCVW